MFLKTTKHAKVPSGKKEFMPCPFCEISASLQSGYPFSSLSAFSVSSDLLDFELNGLY